MMVVGGVASAVALYYVAKSMSKYLPYGSMLKGLLESGAEIPPKTKLDLAIMRKFDELPQKGKVQAEYVWIGGNHEMRCKTKTLPKEPKSVAELPVWNFDGSSTEQAPGTDSEVLLKPAAMFADPFRPGGPNIIVLCDCYLPDPNGPQGLGAPIPTNTRAACKAIMDKVKSKEPWFGIEQECTSSDHPKPRTVSLRQRAAPTNAAHRCSVHVHARTLSAAPPL